MFENQAKKFVNYNAKLCNKIVFFAFAIFYFI